MLKIVKKRATNPTSVHGVHDLDPIGFTIEPARVIFSAAALIFTVIVLQYFAKPRAEI